MSWKTPRHSSSKRIYDKPASIQAHKLPIVKRGGGLRVGRVVSDVRYNQSSSPFVQEEERRVQEELIEMLTVKLANKEKEVEILRCKQNAVDREFAGHNQHRRQEEEEHVRVVSEMSTMNQELQRQVQHLQIQCQRLQIESEAQHTAALEQRRLREKDHIQTRNETKALQQTIDELRREREQSLNDRFVLEEKLQRVFQDKEMQNNLIVQIEAKCTQFEIAISESSQTCQELQEELTSEQHKREDTENKLRRLEREKIALEDKHNVVVKTFKSASSRALEVDKKRSDLSRIETQLTEQLAAYKKENLELKARRGQLNSHTKHLQARVAALETANVGQEQKLQDASIELESARKSSRDLQFRTKQLQEEIVFLKNRKVAALEPNSPSPELNLESSSLHLSVQETEAEDAVPCWMKG